MSDETYIPRGFGQNFLPCYICNLGGNRVAQTDMAAFVDNKESGERIVAMYNRLGLNSVLDYRTHEPNYVQVKIGACDTHRSNLEKLMDLCYKDKKISNEKIVKSLTI